MIKDLIDIITDNDPALESYLRDEAFVLERFRRAEHDAYPEAISLQFPSVYPTATGKSWNVRSEECGEPDSIVATVNEDGTTRFVDPTWEERRVRGEQQRIRMAAE